MLFGVGFGASAQFPGNPDSLAFEPCPGVKIIQKHNHTPLPYYRQQGWDTVVTCNQEEITLTVMPFVPTQFFQGTYTVASIPYDPPDPTFHGGTQIPNNQDDYFCSQAVTIPWKFYFFGILKPKFVAGGNGIITFNESSVGQSCGFGVYSPLPWPDGTTSNTPTLSTHRDAIYGVFHDTDPRGCSGDRGIYYGIQGTYPCRKIIASYNGLPMYAYNSDMNSPQNRWNTYQIVCYEGSNIIEIHVKAHRPSSHSSWTNYGLIGIQNATGANQTTGAVGTSTMFVGEAGARWASRQPYFAPPGCNNMASGVDVDSVAYRFTPMGRTARTGIWYRLNPDGSHDTLALETVDPGNPIGTYSPLVEHNPDLQIWKSTAIVRPDTNYPSSTYVFSLKFKNAAGEWYSDIEGDQTIGLCDTIVVGIDMEKEMTLRAISGTKSNDTVLDLCYGDGVTCTLSYPERQAAQTINWNVQRKLNGVTRDMPRTFFRTENGNLQMSFSPDDRMDTLPKNKIDSIYATVSCNFVSGCSNYKRVLIRIFPNFDTIEHEGICQGDEFKWHVNNQTYKTPTDTTNWPYNLPSKVLQSQPGCDSTVRLHLKVIDTVIIPDPIIDCDSILWHGRVITASNYTDTVVLKDQWGCDSTMRLNFTLHPVKAKIQADRDHFDFDNLDVVLEDVSTGSKARLWSFPTGNDQTGKTAFYSIPVKLSEADIRLIAYSQYGECEDTAHIVLPLAKESFWVPNAFTPDNPDGNNLFGSTSQQTLSQEMFIYNRRGELIFHCEEVDCKWDGRDLKGNPVPQDAYVYLIKYNNTYEPERTFIKRGTVTLIR